MSRGIGRDRLKRLARLGEGKVRRAEGLQLIEGRRLVAEALLAGRLAELFVRDEESARSYRRAGETLPVHVIGPMEMERGGVPKNHGISEHQVSESSPQLTSRELWAILWFVIR